MGDWIKTTACNTMGSTASFCSGNNNNPAPTRAPVPVPTRPPTPAPTRAPTPVNNPNNGGGGGKDDEDCVDQMVKIKGKKNGCRWVGKNENKTKNRCQKMKKKLSKRLYELCPKTCAKVGLGICARREFSK